MGHDLPARRLTCDVLRSAGFEVETFHSPRNLLSAPPPEGPSCTVLDLDLPEPGGLALIRRLTRRGDSTPVIVLSGQPDVRTSVRAIKEGAIDYLCKPAAEDELIAAVREGIALDFALRTRRAEEQALRSRFAALTGREHEVCGMAASGLLNKQIADTLGLHERTVKLHRSVGMRKLGVHSLAEMVRLFMLSHQFTQTEAGVHCTLRQSPPDASSTKMGQGR